MTKARKNNPIRRAEAQKPVRLGKKPAKRRSARLPERERRSATVDLHFPPLKKKRKRRKKVATTKPTPQVESVDQLAEHTEAAAEVSVATVDTALATTIGGEAVLLDLGDLTSFEPASDEPASDEPAAADEPAVTDDSAVADESPADEPAAADESVAADEPAEPESAALETDSTETDAGHETAAIDEDVLVDFSDFEDLVATADAGLEGDELTEESTADQEEASPAFGDPESFAFDEPAESTADSTDDSTEDHVAASDELAEASTAPDEPAAEIVEPLEPAAPTPERPARVEFEPPSNPDMLPVEAVWIEEGVDPDELEEPAMQDIEAVMEEYESAMSSTGAETKGDSEAGATAIVDDPALAEIELPEEISFLAATMPNAPEFTPSSEPLDPALAELLNNPVGFDTAEFNPIDSQGGFSNFGAAAASLSDPATADWPDLGGRGDSPASNWEPAAAAEGLEMAPAASSTALVENLRTEEPWSGQDASDLASKIEDLTTSLQPLVHSATQDGTGATTSASEQELKGKLEEIIGGLDTLKNRTAGYEQLESCVQDIKGSTEKSHAKRDILTGMLSNLGEEVRDLQTQLGVTSKATLASAKTVQRLREQVQDVGNRSVGEAPRALTASRAIKPSTMVMGVGVLLLSWAMMFYLKTGNAHVALLGLVVVNIAGCATILLSKSDDGAQ